MFIMEGLDVDLKQKKKHKKITNDVKKNNDKIIEEKT